MSRNTLWQAGDGSLPTPESVSVKINKLENDLRIAQEDLRNSKKALLVEQERSTAMIRSITGELERTRKELDSAKSATMDSVADSVRLASLERELNEARRALQMIKTAPTDPTQKSYLDMQNELRNALAEITKMQIELGDKNDLERQLARLKESMEIVEQNKGRTANPDYANKLLIELNDAKREVKNAKSLSRQEGKELIQRVAFLENELKASQLALEKTKTDLESTKEKMAREEFEFASTIQRLEEDAQLAQSSLNNASLGQLPAIPFVEEMEKNLASSEERIRIMSEQFESEQSKASELINGLKVELESAVLRQKSALDQLARKEAELEGKNVELRATKDDAKKLKEELEVVKVIAGQLEDLNTVLDQTKETQSSQSSSLQQVVESLKEELNQAKVELVFALEETEKYKSDSANMIGSLERQLEDTRNQLLAEQENQADYTNETKDLILDLKSELVVARQEIARMKSAGMGESVQTKQAVSQLQEALGTIRILQESLEEAEKVNLEVDNLRSQLANSMESQLLELQSVEDEKADLRKKTNDLEAEIALLRENKLGSGVQFQKSNAELIENLEVSKSRIAELEKRAAMTEDNEVLSLIDLEEELAKEKFQNQSLQAELAKKGLVRNKTVDLLEAELSSTLKKIEDLESRDDKRLEQIANLENELAEAIASKDSEESDIEVDLNQIAIVDELESQLLDAQNRILDLQKLQPTKSEDQENNSPYSQEEFSKLEAKLSDAEDTIANLELSLDSQEVKRKSLQDKLDDTIAKLDDVLKNDKRESGQEEFLHDVNGEEITIMEKELLVAQKTINDLLSKIESEENQRKDLENRLAKAVEAIDQQGTIANSDERLSEAQKTIDELLIKTDLEEAQREKLEEQLANALAKLDGLDMAPQEKGIEHSQTVSEFKSLLAEKEIKLKELEEELSNAIVDLTEKEAELEAASFLRDEVEQLAKKLELAETKLLDNGSTTPDPQISALQGEIDLLKSELENAKSLPISNDQTVKKLQSQLQDAVSYSFEVQTELEETKERLSQLESQQGNVSDQQLDKLLSDAKDNEEKAQNRIGELTNALKNSENLRKEMESLLSEIDLPNDTEVKDIANDPRFIELQDELALLQQDLINARQLDDPEVQKLRADLEVSQNDSLRLNEEFKDAMDNFRKIKEQVAVLEEENKRLQDTTLTDAKNQSQEAISNLNSEIDDLSDANQLLKSAIRERDNRIESLTEQLAQSQMNISSSVEPDSAALRGQIVRLEGALETARSNETRAKQNAQNSFLTIQDLNQNIKLLEGKLRDAMSNARGFPSSLQNDATVSFDRDALNDEINMLKEENRMLNEKLRSPSTLPARDQLDRRIRDLNQKNLMAQIQLDQERARVGDLRKQLAESRDIKQEIVERGQSANLKVGLLNDELDDAKKRIFSLEQALILARDAIRVLKSQGDSSDAKVSVPNTLRRSNSYTPSYGSNNYVSAPRPIYPGTTRAKIPSPIQSTQGNSILSSPTFRSSSIQQLPPGDSSIQLSAQIQFLNNKNRPAGFSEFFLVKSDLDSILNESGIRIPSGRNIKSSAELWARSVQRGYRYPGVASSIRNALASKSLARLKTNSIGKANLDNIEPGNYYVIGTSPLGQVGVVWSKSVRLIPGSNNISLDLRDAEWAQ
jgi:chromosome segregation ATPase